MCVYGWGEGQAQVLENGVHYNQCLQNMNSELQSLRSPIHLLWPSGRSCFSCTGAPPTPPAPPQVATPPPQVLLLFFKKRNSAYLNTFRKWEPLVEPKRLGLVLNTLILFNDSSVLQSRKFFFFLFEISNAARGR